MEMQRPVPVVATAVLGLLIVSFSVLLVAQGNRDQGVTIETVDTIVDQIEPLPDELAFNEHTGSVVSEFGAVTRRRGTIVWPGEWDTLGETRLARRTTAPAPSTTAPDPTAGGPQTTAEVAPVSTTAPPSTTAAPSTTAPPTTVPPTTVPPTTAPPTTVPPTTAPPTTASPSTPPPTAALTSGGSTGGLEALRNRNAVFSRYASVPNTQLDLGALTEQAPRRDNGTVGDGQFRIACQYSHFAYDDPIVFPGQPGRAHLHMFFGNTAVNANTTTASLLNSGGGTCNGFELNRSGYWVPALLDGRGNTLVPEKIIIYYKTTRPHQVQALPQDLRMIAGNTDRDSFQVSNELFWSCGRNGKSYNKSNRIPDCGGDVINASIVFPQCWDGRNLDSPDHRSHLVAVNTEVDCPASHPVRFPQISILLYYPGQPSVQGWHLSSDRTGGFNTAPGATLHADWWGGWNDDAMNLWIDGCMKAARNCSFGQTGTDRAFARLNDQQNYGGPYLLPLP